MGLFDSVRVKCPDCSEELLFQSKAGDCLLNIYNTDDVPVEIAASLDGDGQQCHNCGKLIELVLDSAPPRTVEMRVK